MSSDVEAHVLGRLAASPIATAPFPHCVIDRIFPADFYEEILDQWPEGGSWQPLGESGRVLPGSYAERMVVLMDGAGFARLDERRRQFWQTTVGAWLLGERLRAALLDKFASTLAEEDFGAPLENTRGDALIVSDRTNYAIGPHTDATLRVASLLFYLPEDATFRRYGTSFYQPLDPTFRCRGGPHYDFKGFRNAGTVEFLPNRLVVFPKSSRCFHGVEPVELPGIERRLLIYNVRRIH
jgi:hypothetical protein